MHRPHYYNKVIIINNQEQNNIYFPIGFVCIVTPKLWSYECAAVDNIRTSNFIVDFIYIYINGIEDSEV